MCGPDLTHAAWHKSRFSGSSGACVEVARLDGGRVAVRDSKAPSGPALVFVTSQWRAFVGGVRNGSFDLLG
ncbi:MAG: DUF397 domain-containing protein [Carbonactinosporaceae bacterium]